MVSTISDPDILNLDVIFRVFENSFILPQMAFDVLVVDQGLLFCSAEPNDFLSIFFYTTLFASLWAWVFMLGTKLCPLFVWLAGDVLDIDSHPVGAAMTIGGVFFGLMIIISGYVWRLFQSGAC